MNAKVCLLAILPALISMLLGCSETTKKETPLPDIISKVHFPYIKDNKLFSFDPVSGEAEMLAESELNLFLALDTDKSNKKVNDKEEEEIFLTTSSAEYIVYANKQSLYIYDLNTRKEHTLFSFKENLEFSSDDQTLISAPESYICDIQKVITLDEDARLSKTTIYKDELKVYVKTSLDSECTNVEQNISYWQIDIIESEYESYTVRRHTLLEHTHKHTHFHDHDDLDYDLAQEHAHEHTLEDGDKDPNNNNVPFDQNNHEHSHKHTHDFVYPEEHFHEHLTTNEINEIHQSSLFHKTVSETHPVLIGRKSSIYSISEALMYSGKPVVDIKNRVFGYLGLDSQENTFHFYSVNLDTLEKKLLWTLKSDFFQNLTNTPATLSPIEKLTGEYNRPSNFKYINENILLSADNKLFYFTLDEIFNDDESDAREYKLLNPVFESHFASKDISSRFEYNFINHNMAIIEDIAVWSVHFTPEGYESPVLIKDFSNIINPDNAPDSITASYLGDSILVTKYFNDTPKPLTSIVSLLSSGLESQTLFTKTEDIISTSTINFREDIDSSIPLYLRTNINIKDAETEILSSTEFDRNLGQLNPPTLHSFRISSGVDYRTKKDIAPYLKSENLQLTPNSLSTPSLYLKQGDILENLGEMPEDIYEASKVVIFDSKYGLIEATGVDDEKNLYLFSVGKSSFNLDGEYEIMKKLP